jgi:hypothetical protein
VFSAKPVLLAAAFWASLGCEHVVADGWLADLQQRRKQLCVFVLWLANAGFVAMGPIICLYGSAPVCAKGDVKLEQNDYICIWRSHPLTSEAVLIIGVRLQPASVARFYGSTVVLKEQIVDISRKHALLGSIPIMHPVYIPS